MEPAQLTSGFLPFPDNCIASNLAPIHEERTETTGLTRRASGEAAAPASKRQKLTYACEPCGKTYTEKRALARHKHTDLHRSNTGLPPLEKYVCSFQPCPKSFTRDHDRRRHEDESHRGLKRPNASKTSPSSGSSPTDMKYTHERSFITFEDDVTSPQNGWDQLGTKMEVLPGPANWATANRVQRARPERENGISRKHHALTREGREDSGVSTESADSQHGQSWFKEDTDDEENGEQDQSTPASQLSVERSKSSAADSAVDMSEDLNEPHEPKRPSITTYDYRNEHADEKLSVHSNNSAADTRAESPSSLVLPLRPKATIIQKSGKSPTIIPAKRPIFCAFCDQSFADNEGNFWPHLRQHLDAFSGHKAMWCNTCKIPFKHKADLDKHRMSADLMNHCGFNFEHSLNCTGHHPPNKASLFPGLSDRDRLTLCTQLEGWELKQLQLYMGQVDEVAAVQRSRPNTVYSVEALYRHKKSRDSYSSFAVSVDTHISAPCDRGVGDTAVDVKGLGSRLKMMSLKSSTIQVRHTAKKLPSMLRSGVGLNKALYNAARCNDHNQIAYLVHNGADPNALLGERSILSAAAEWADAATINLLLNLGANACTPESGHLSPVTTAVHPGNADNYKLLLTEGAHVLQPGGKCGSALSAAATAGRVEIAELLLEHGADVNQRGGHWGTPAGAAAAHGKLDMVTFLLNNGADPDGAGGQTSSPLLFAVHHNYMDVVQLLIKRGANINASSGQRGNPLSAAVVNVAERNAGPAMVRLLLELGADVDQKGSSNPLRTAAANCHVEAITDVVRLLLRCGADTHVTGSKGTALQLAKKQRQHWMEKKPFELLELPNRREHLDDTIGYCYDVIRLLKEADASEDGRCSSSVSWRASEDIPIARTFSGSASNAVLG